MIEQYFFDVSPHWVALLLAVIPALINIGLIYYLIVKLPSRNILNVFIAWLVAIVCWQVLDSYNRIGITVEIANKLDIIFSVGWLLVAPISFHFFSLFTRTFHGRIRSLVLFNYLITLVIMGIYPFITLPSDYYQDSFWGWVHEFSEIDIIVPIWLGLLSFEGLLLLFLNFRKCIRHSDQYYQFLLVMISYGICVAQSFLTEFFIPLVFNTKTLPLTSSTFTLFTVSTVIAINRYGLFNGEDIINKSLILSSISDIVISVNRKNKISYINQSGLKIFGIAYNEVIGKDMSDLIEIKPPVENDDPISIVKTYSNKNLKAIVIQNELREKNKHIGTIFLLHNITELENAYKQTEIQKSYLQQLFNASPLSIVMTDNDLNIKIANKSFLQMYGYSFSEIENKNLNDLILPQEDKYAQESVSRVLTEKTVQSFESRRMRSNGDIFDVLVIGYPIVINNEIVGLYGIYNDITDTKVAERQLVQNNIDLQKANSELDLFVYHASHDIRSPLMSIIGLVRMAKDEIKDAQSTSYFNMIENLIYKLDEFTLQIIHFSRNNRTNLQAQKIQMKSLIIDTLDLLKYSETARKINISIDVNDNLEFISDSARIQIILANLLSNAIKYHKAIPGASFINISAKLEGNALDIKIEDNGMGIIEDKLDKIFDMFSRFSDMSEGSGLGLYIVKEIVDRLDGSITAKSRLNEGTSFTVTIPEMQFTEK